MELVRFVPVTQPRQLILFSKTSRVISACSLITCLDQAISTQRRGTYRNAALHVAVEIPLLWTQGGSRTQSGPQTCVKF